MYSAGFNVAARPVHTNRLVLVFTSGLTRYLMAINVTSGEEAWKHGHDDPSYSSPLVAEFDWVWQVVERNHRALLGGENRGVHSIRPELNDGKWTVADEWHQKEVAIDMSSGVINSDQLHGFSHYDGGRLFCLDPKTGEVLWGDAVPRFYQVSELIVAALSILRPSGIIRSNG